jgi:hypothetical protein
MFDSVVLDIVIGLVFIYLLYSLLITILGEIAMEKMGVRARILRKAIEKMLNDGYPSTPVTFTEKVKEELREFFLAEHDEFPQSFAARFYDQPSIKYLTRSHGRLLSWVPKQSKPAYFSGRNFAETLIHIFRDAGAGSSDMERIRFCLQRNTLRLEQETLEHFMRIERDAAGDPDKLKLRLEMWFDETMDRASGWYKTKLRLVLFLLGFTLAVAFNIDTFRIVSLLSKDTRAREQLVQMSTSFVKDTTHISKLVHVNGDTLKAGILYDSAFSRVSRDADDASRLLGIGWDAGSAVVPATDTLTRMRDSALFHAVAGDHALLCGQVAASAKARSQVAHTTFRIRQTDSIVRAEARDTLNTLDSMILATDTMTVKRLQAKLASQRKRISTHLSLLSLLMQKQHADSTSCLKTEAAIARAGAPAYHSSGRKLAVIDSLKYDTVPGKIILYGRRPLTICETTGQILSAALNPFSRSFWGFVITALALSLGAPFWFDLLSKLVSIRSGGVKPEEKKTGTTPDSSLVSIAQANTTPAQVLETPLDTAMRMYKDSLKRMKGVLNVEFGYLPGKKDNRKSFDCIIVHTEDQPSAAGVLSKYPSLDIGTHNNVPLSVRVTGTAMLANGTAAIPGPGIPEKAIYNKATPKNTGSFGCIVQDKKDPAKLSLLTCYHVVNADNKWDAPPAKGSIRGYNGKALSDTYTGFLNTHQDTALIPVDIADARFYRNIEGARFPSGKKSVSVGDIYETKVIVEGFTSSTPGMIIHDSCSYTFTYPLQRAQRIDDMIMISYEGGGSVPQMGNSGALVLDLEGNALGIVIAADRLNLYAIKITTILDELGVDIILKQTTL